MKNCIHDCIAIVALAVLMTPCHTYGMNVRTTLDIPISLHREIKRRAQGTNRSMRQVILRFVEDGIHGPKKGRPVTGALITGKGKRGPLYPTDENPVDFMVP